MPGQIKSYTLYRRSVASLRSTPPLVKTLRSAWLLATPRFTLLRFNPKPFCGFSARQDVRFATPPRRGSLSLLRSSQTVLMLRPRALSLYFGTFRKPLNALARLFIHSKGADNAGLPWQRR
jgi:hypothetical protein